MAGLEGFTQGFGLADNFIRGREQNVRQDKELAMRQKTNDLQTEASQRMLDKDLGQQYVAAAIQGREVDKSDPQYQAWVKRNPMLNWDHLKSEKTQGAVDFADRLAKGDVEGGLHSPETAAQIDAFYQPLIQKDDGLHRRVVGVYPGQKEGTIALDLEVTDADGNKRNSPMTARRSVDDDDEIKQIDIGDMIGQVQATKSLLSQLKPVWDAQSQSQQQPQGQGQGQMPRGLAIQPGVQAEQQQAAQPGSLQEFLQQNEQRGRGNLSAQDYAYYKSIGLAPKNTSGSQVFQDKDGSTYLIDADNNPKLIQGRERTFGSSAMENVSALMDAGYSKEEAVSMAFKTGAAARTQYSPGETVYQGLQAKGRYYAENPDSPVAQALLGARATKAGDYARRRNDGISAGLEGEELENYALFADPNGSKSDVARQLASDRAKSKGDNAPDMPVAAVKEESTNLSALTSTFNGNIALGGFVDKLKSKKLDFGYLENAKNSGLNLTNNPTPQSIELAEFRSAIALYVNESLRANKGVQTDGDRVAEAAAVINNTNNNETVIANLQYIINSNKRNMTATEAIINSRRKTLKAESYDFDSLYKYMGGNGNTTMGLSGAPSRERPKDMPSLDALERQVDGPKPLITTQEQLNALPKGTKYLRPDGKTGVRG